jgi:hypothetical protein
LNDVWFTLYFFGTHQQKEGPQRMIKCLFSKNKNHNKAAHVAANKLVLSFPNAVTPIVWQVDLREVTVSYFEINMDEKKDIYLLTMSKQGSNAKPAQIAQFSNQSAASKALNDIAEAMINAQKTLGSVIIPADSGKQVVSHPYKKAPGTLKTIIWTIVVLLLLFFAVTYLMARGSYDSADDRYLSPSSSNTAVAPPAAGVPLSADEYLRGQ